MKKSLVALAALAFVGAASAQSSVTLFGVVDTAVSGYSNKSKSFWAGSATVSQTALTSSGYNASRLGFRGTEDLGGGLAASFWLEAGLNTDTGQGAATGGGLTFNRRSTVSLSGNFGEVRLGRDYTPTFWNDTVFDPFGTNGVGTNLIYVNASALTSGFARANSYERASNSVAYFLPPNLGGFYGQLSYAFDEKTSYDPGGATPPGLLSIIANPSAIAVDDNARAGRYIGGRVGYASGPLDVALSYGENTLGSNYYGGATTSSNTWNLGASYDFGVVKLFGEYSNMKIKTDWQLGVLNNLQSNPKIEGYLIGATMPLGAGLLRASYGAVKYDNVAAFGSSEPKADKFALGYVYNLSKRTAVYATAAYLKNKNGLGLTLGGPAFVGAANGIRYTPDTSTGYDLGVRHSF